VKRYVTLAFDDDGCHDYDPPLLHPAEVFLRRFSSDKDFRTDTGAVAALETEITFT
jgi:hypothetical protein